MALLELGARTEMAKIRSLLGRGTRRHLPKQKAQRMLKKTMPEEAHPVPSSYNSAL